MTKPKTAKKMAKPKMVMQKQTKDKSHKKLNKRRKIDQAYFRLPNCDTKQYKYAEVSTWPSISINTSVKQ